jgi:alginate O-acetyltransferase complex protein AlgI
MPVLPLVCRKAEQQTGSVYACLQALSYAGVLALLLVDILHLSAASYVPFIYFQF